MASQTALNPVGIDVGLTNLLALSDGSFVAAPKHYRAGEKKQRRLQRALARCQRRSRKRLKAKRNLARHSEYIANQRRDYNHKVTSDLIKTYDGFAVEDLQIQNMTKNRHLAKSIQDASWNQIISFLTYKAESAGMTCVKVNPRGTSQNCSACGHIPDVKKTLSDRWHECPECGYAADRDTNAARNILQKSGLGTRLTSVTGGANKLVDVVTAGDPAASEAACFSWR